MNTYYIIQESLGYAGAFFLSILNLPQIFYSIKKPETLDSLSPKFLGLQFITNLCFLTYGIMIPLNQIILSNTASTLGSIILLSLWIKRKRNYEINNKIVDC